MASVAIVFSILGIVFNLIPIISLMTNTGVKHQMTTPYILSVLFTDLMFSTFLLPMLAVRFYTRQSEENIWPGLCKLFPVLFYVSFAAFILSLMCVTINQTCIIFFQERTEKIFNAKVRIIIILFCWFLPLACMIPPMSGSYGTIGLNEYTQSCTIMPDEYGRCPKAIFYNILLFFACTVKPF